MENKFFNTQDGLKLEKRNWLVPNPKANVVLLHGYAEHSGRYNYEAALLNALDISVFAYDHRGYGRSEGERAYINRFEEYIKDFEIFLNLNKEELDSKPLFLFGHSMGGLILVSYFLGKPIELPSLKGMILSAPALMIHRDISPFLQKISGIMSILAPRLQTVPLNNKVLSHDPKVYEDHEKDPLNYKGKTKARMGGEMIKQIKSLKNSYAKFNLPFLLMHGTDDRHAEIEGSRRLFKEAISSDKTMKEWEGMYHEITKELDKEEVMQTMLDWIKKRL